jgi:hypothetical protein|tara:strand:- start:273 stop:533 length:261 start_codon:yes stop_codon:yes gene_type:complete
MNGKKSKLIRKKSKLLVVAWIKSLLPEEEASKVNLKNYHSLVPPEKHIYSNSKLFLSAYTEKWFRQKIKKLIKTKKLENINLQDFL